MLVSCPSVIAPFIAPVAVTHGPWSPLVVHLATFPAFIIIFKVRVKWWSSPLLFLRKIPLKCVMSEIPYKDISTLPCHLTFMIDLRVRSNPNILAGTVAEEIDLNMDVTWRK